MISQLINFAAACPSKGIPVLPSWYKYLDSTTVAGKCTPKITTSPGELDPAAAGKILLAVAEIILRVGGLVAVGFVIYGGFKFILSQGDPESAKNARQTIINALIGLVIAASATFIVNLVGGSFI